MNQPSAEDPADHCERSSHENRMIRGPAGMLENRRIVHDKGVRMRFEALEGTKIATGHPQSSTPG